MKIQWFIGPVALLLFLACNVSNNTAAERAEFERDMEAQIAGFDQQIHDAKSRAAEMSGDSRTGADDMIVNLEERRDALTGKLQAMKAAGDADWQAFQTDVQAAAQDLGQAIGNMQGTFNDATSGSN